MATKKHPRLFAGDILDEQTELSFGEFCRACGLPAEYIKDLIEHGAIEPAGRDPRSWRFSGACLRRVQISVRVQRDLGVNVAGAALVLDLLEEVQELRARLARFEN